MTEPATNDSHHFLDRALVVGQRAIKERDPRDKRKLIDESLLYYACGDALLPSDPDTTCAMGELLEACARFYSYAEPPKALLDFYADSAGYLWEQTIVFYEKASRHTTCRVVEANLAAREHLAELMEEGFHTLEESEGGAQNPFSPTEIFDYRLETANKGYPLSQARIAQAYYDGKGITQSWDKARHWAEVAARDIRMLPHKQASDLMDLLAAMKQLEGIKFPFYEPMDIGGSRGATQYFHPIGLAVMKPS